MEPDDAGLELIDTARRIRHLVGEVGDRLSGQAVPLRIASCEVLSRSHAAPLLTQWSAVTGQPGSLAVYDSLFEVPKENFDVMVTPLESAPEDMIGRRIDVLRWSLFASESYLAHHPFLTGSQTLDGHLVIHPSGSLAEVATYRWLRERGGKVTFSSSSPLLQRDAAIAGTGIALLPEAIIDRDTPLVRLRASAEPPTTDIWMISRKDARVRPSVTGFLEWANGSRDDRRSSAGAAR